MKKTALLSFAVIMILAVLAGCSAPNTGDSQSMQYVFEFSDVDGNVHKLSDYEGRPVYLEVWGTWCSICMESLDEMNEFAGQEKEYQVLSVVFPGHAGEKNKEDFISWYKETGYDNLIVLLDSDIQIAKDFGINGFPSNIFFDAKGNFAGGQVGKMTPAAIDEAMNNLAKQQDGQ